MEISLNLNRSMYVNVRDGFRNKEAKKQTNKTKHFDWVLRRVVDSYVIILIGFVFVPRAFLPRVKMIWNSDHWKTRNRKLTNKLLSNSG